LTARGAAVLDVLRETVVELHHEVVEEAAQQPPPAPLRLAGPPQTAASSVKSRRSAGRKPGSPRR
jgi:hypothetical protein